MALRFRGGVENQLGGEEGRVPCLPGERSELCLVAWAEVLVEGHGRGYGVEELMALQIVLNAREAELVQIEPLIGWHHRLQRLEVEGTREWAVSGRSCDFERVQVEMKEEEEGRVSFRPWSSWSLSGAQKG